MHTLTRSNLANLASEQGARVFGVADLERLQKNVPDLLARVGEGYARAIVCGVRLQKAVLDGIADSPTPLYFHNYRQANYQLDTIALALADRMQEAGWRALAVPASQVISRDPMSGHISHKLLGWSAGLGHIGRNNLLVHPRYGSQVRYVSVLTDMPLPADGPVDGDCGACRACVSACPARAIGERAKDFNLTACYAKLTEFTHLPFIGQHICGVCLKTCPGRT